MSAMTLTEKILAKHAGRGHVEPGDNVWIDTDVLMTHDVCGPGTIGIFKQHFGQNAKVWDRGKIVIIPDHYIFTQDKMANRNVDVLRQFAAEQKIEYFYDVGTPRYKGVCHIALPEPHLHGGSVRGIRHGHRQYRRRFHHGDRKIVGQDTADNALYFPRQIASLFDGQGPHLGGDRRYWL
jgi:hypothetical protein